MLQLFPDISKSAFVEFTIPSKKAQRRFGSSTRIPGFIAGDVYRRLDDRIRANVFEVARASLAVTASSNPRRSPTNAAMLSLLNNNTS
jgi:hypothetical protein